MAQSNLPTMYSDKPEAPKEKIIENVIDGDEFVTRRRPLMKKIADILLNGDVKTVKEYLINDVLIPSVKETIFELVNRGLDMMLFNDGRRMSSTKNNPTYISYNNYSNRESRKSYEQTRRYVKDPVMPDDEELIFKEIGPAQMVLEKLFAIYEDYHIVTKADLNDVLNRTGNFTDNNWGWTDLSGACVERVRGGYLLRLPKMRHLD